MISKQNEMVLSPYMALYDLIIPKDNVLRQINELVDFTFILDELQSKYCLDNGRNAIPPIRMFKYLLLKSFYDLSDVDLVERSKFDMSFKYFLDMAPEDPVIDPSSLTKFRRLRLEDINLLDLLIQKTVQIAIEQGVMKSKIVIVDSTHTRSRYQPKSPNEYLQEKSKLLRKSAYQLDEKMVGKFPEKPATNDLEDELTYCQEVLETVEANPQLSGLPAIIEKVNVLKETMDDIEHQRSYSTDSDAKIGYKSAENSFFGYKTHLAMSDERIITAAVITTGDKSDTHYLQELVQKSKATGMEIETVIGDTAYSSKNNIKFVNEEGLELVSKLHPIITHGHSKKEGFVFNKDAGLYTCPAGHLATNKRVLRRASNTNRNDRMKYFFDIKKCQVCPLKENCYKEGARVKTYTVAIKSNEHLQQEAFQGTAKFKNLAKLRYKIEAKNNELKNRHGLKKSKSAGLLSMHLQGATAIFVVNLKRILKLLNEND